MLRGLRKRREDLSVLFFARACKAPSRSLEKLLVAPAASPAGENHAEERNDCGKNPTHLSLPSLGLHVCSSGGLVGDLRA
jgi:hypothetical protein